MQVKLPRAAGPPIAPYTIKENYAKFSAAGPPTAPYTIKENYAKFNLR